MDKTILNDDFHKTNFKWLHENILKEMGHFRVAALKPFVGDEAKPSQYKRQNYYKFMLIYGGGKVHYGNKELSVQNHVLSFSSPQTPHQWEDKENITGGFYCIFDQDFFYDNIKFNQYLLFQSNGLPAFELSIEQAQKVQNIYNSMIEEINADYVYKYDVLRNLVLELVHFAMKMMPSAQINNESTNASQRILTQFLELLERQFPIYDNHSLIKFRVASDFADELNIHVNYLNRAIKKITLKTTSQFIAERVLQESKVLLKYSNWNVSEIAYTLGFTEVTHFNNFFKKHTQTNPSKFREVS